MADAPAAVAVPAIAMLAIRETIVSLSDPDAFTFNGSPNPSPPPFATPAAMLDAVQFPTTAIVPICASGFTSAPEIE